MTPRQSSRAPTKLVDSWTNLKRRAHSDLKHQVKAEKGPGRPPNNSALGTQPELRACSAGLGKLIYRHSIINSFRNWTSYKQKSEKKFNHFRLKCESRLKTEFNEFLCSFEFVEKLIHYSTFCGAEDPVLKRFVTLTKKNVSKYVCHYKNELNFNAWVL